MEFQDVVRRRRMVRRFDRREIPEDVLKRILEVARHAPSAGFSQGFDFVVLSKPEELELFYATCDDPRDPDPFPGRADDMHPACIVLPYSNKRAYLDRYSQPDKIEFGLDKEEAWPVPFWTVDTAMAMLLILLAAVDEGLGAWYLGISRGDEELKQKLGVPPESQMLGPIAIGFVSPEDKPRTALFAKRRRAFEDMFHFGRW